MEIKMKIRFKRTVFSASNVTIAGADVIESSEEYELNKYGNITVIGDYEIENYKKIYEVTVVEDTSSKYPASYKLIRIHHGVPTDAIGQWRYLEGAGILSKMQIMAIRKNLGADVKVLDLIVSNHPGIMVKGVGPKTVKRAQLKILSEMEKGAFYAKFSSIPGISDGMISKIIAIGPDTEKTIREIEENPFMLLDIDGFGFQTADLFREAVGIPIDDPKRCMYGVRHYLSAHMDSTGDTYAVLSKISSYLAQKLKVGEVQIIKYIESHTLNDFGLATFSGCLTTIEMLKAETYSYKEINSRVKDSTPMINEDKYQMLVDNYIQENNLELSQGQLDFLIGINTSKVSLMVGSGGTGKSWVTKIATDILSSQGLDVGLYAPTAKAAKVISNYTSREAQTIHRGMMSLNKVTGKNSIVSVSHDIVFVDETSMVDAMLLETILASTEDKGSRIVFIGDDFQLPSVGPGNVLYDLQSYMDIPKVKLTRTFRQESGSGIIEVCDNIRGRSLKLDTSQSEILFGDDARFTNTSDAEDILNNIMIDFKKNIHQMEKTMVLTPVNKGASGRVTINKSIQKNVNPQRINRAEIVFKKNLEESEREYYRVGDRITISKNIYNAFKRSNNPEATILVNGDEGEIVACYSDRGEEFIEVLINGFDYEFSKGEIMEYVDLSYSLTIHKSQGSQAEEVIIAIPSSAAWQLNANMVYTAVSRASKNVHVIGDFKTINRALKKFDNFNRQTLIKFMSVAGL